MKKVFQSLSLTLFVFGFAGWVYIALNAVFHPDTLPLPLTHLLPWPREDTFGAACFGIAFIALFVHLMLRDPRSRK